MGITIGVYMGIMEKKMETIIMGYIGIIGYILGFIYPKIGTFHPMYPHWGTWGS